MAYKRKTRDEWCLMYNYGYGDGAEVICYCEDYNDAKATRRDYIENEGIYPSIRRKRVRIDVTK